MPGEVRSLVIEILGKSKEAVAAFAETDKAAGRSEGAMSKLGTVGGLALVTIGVAVGASLAN